MEVRDSSELMRSQGQSAGDGVRVTQLHPATPQDGALVALDLWELEAGSTTKPVSGAEEQIFFVVSGTGQIGGGENGATLSVVPGSVVRVGPNETHTLNNTGREPLRILATVPLLVKSARLLGLPTAAPPAELPQPTLTSTQASRPSVQESRPSAPTPPPVAETRTAPAPAPSRTPEPTVEAPEPELEAPLPDISALMKKGSEVASKPEAERRKPPPMPEPEPDAAQVETPQEEEDEEGHSNLMELLAIFDGGSRGNPGQGYGSFLVQSPNRKPVIKRLDFGDNYTNNQAEYDSLIGCLHYIIERLEITSRSPEQVQLDIRTDSDLVVNQILGNFKVKDAGLKKRHAQATELLERFGQWQITWHPREESVRLLGH